MAGNQLAATLKRIKECRLEKEVDIHTPMGVYKTSETLAAELEKFFEDNYKEYTGAIGGQYSYEFTPTSMGLILVIKDDASKNEINVTNYANW